MTRIKRSFRVLAIFAVAVLATACANNTYRAGEACDTGSFSVIDGFSAARRGTCTVLSESRVRLEIRPESEGKINDSPWYAFKLVPSSPGKATITLRYHNGHHRYRPKISSDGLNWTLLADDQVARSANGRRADIEVNLGSDAVWIAAQEIVLPLVYDVWNNKTAKTAGVTLRKIGVSKHGLPLHALDSNNTSKEVLFLIGRQHPPEVTGALAFVAFAKVIFGDSELASQFRDRFRVVAIPLMNPDGVVGGHWRHNLGDVDLNRDWGLFSQPETRRAVELLDELDHVGAKLRMFIDFHSTKKNVFYTQQQPTQPPNFTSTWLDNAAARLSDYPFDNEESPGNNATVAKNYIFNRYGIPAVTYEVGDETNRSAIRVAARVFAEELMALMLKQDY